MVALISRSRSGVFSGEEKCLEEMEHQLEIIYNQVPGKVSTLNSSELMADNVRAAARGSSSALKTAEGNFDVDHHSGAE